MNLTSLRKSYSKLLESFKEAGVVLNESQQGNLENFMSSLENKLIETRKAAIITTKRMMQEKLDREYKTLTENLIKHMQENVELNEKIQQKLNENKQLDTMADAVDEYLDLYVEEYLPKKTIVDYSRMQKLEQIHESLKTMLNSQETKVFGESCSNGKACSDGDEDEEVPGETPVNPEDGEEAPEEKKEQVPVKPTTECQKKTVDPKEFLKQKVKNLPKREAEIVQESLKDASVSEIKMKFRLMLESAREQIEQETKNFIDKSQTPSNTEDGAEEDGLKSLEEEINDIIKGGDEIPSRKTTDRREDEAFEADEDGVAAMESYINPEEDVVVDGSYMKMWMSRC